MRAIFFLMILAGFGVGFGYPWYMENRSGAELGTYTVYRQTTGFTPVDVVLSQGQSPVRIFADMTPLRGFNPDISRTMLTFTASTGGRTVMTSTLSFVSSRAETRNPQNAEKIFRDVAGELIVTTPGAFRLVVGEGDIEGLSLKKVDLVLRANAKDTDPRAFPVGMGLFGLGIFGMIRWKKRGAAPVGQTATPPPAEPEKPKWGRDAADE